MSVKHSKNSNNDLFVVYIIIIYYLLGIIIFVAFAILTNRENHKPLKQDISAFKNSLYFLRDPSSHPEMILGLEWADYFLDSAKDERNLLEADSPK
jgi:hypothetical protein